MPTLAYCLGSPEAYVDVAPVCRLILSTRPDGPSVTYSAPSGPTVLPEPHPPVQPAAAKVVSSCATGCAERCRATAGELPIAATTVSVASSVTIRRVLIRAPSERRFFHSTPVPRDRQ